MKNCRLFPIVCKGERQKGETDKSGAGGYLFFGTQQ